MLVWCWQQVKDLILEFLISGKKTTFWLLYYSIILVSFPLGGCVDEVVDSQANYQGYRYGIHFLWCHIFAVMHSVNGEGIC